MASHFRDFTRMSSPTLYGSRLVEDPKDFLGRVYKILYDIGVMSLDHLKDVAQTLYVQWRDNMALRGGLGT